MKDDWLLEFEKNITSQTGEDGILEKIIEVITPDNNWCVEFGAWDGKRHSNTYNLIVNKGWHGVLIEANDQKFKELVSTYQENSKVHPIKRFVDFEGKNALDSILSSTEIPTNFALLSIDIDGNDYHIWDSLKKFQPEIVVIEFNPSIPNDLRFIQPRDMSVNQGSSLLSIAELSKEKGYEMVAATKLNGIFVKKQNFGIFNISDNSPSNLNKQNKQQETRLFQLYDGTLVLDGCNKLLWKKNFIITPEDIQVLPPKERYLGTAVQHSNYKGRPAGFAGRFFKKLKKLLRNGYG